MGNPFAPVRYNQTASPTSAFMITPNDSADLPTYVRFIMATIGGAVKVDMIDGGTVTIPAFGIGVMLPVGVKRVYQTGTSAIGLIGFY